MDAGREMDLLIEEKIFGRRTRYQVRRYSTDIAAAWQVAERMRDRLACKVEMAVLAPPFNRSYHVCAFDGVQGWGDTMPLAICRAALAAVDR